MVPLMSLCVLLPILGVVSANTAPPTPPPIVRHGGLQDFDAYEEPENQLHRKDFVENKEHIKEHLKGEANIDVENASTEEMEFHFFKIHDLDGDNQLDGIELLHAISHGLEEQVNRINQMDATPEQKKERLDRMKERHVSAVDRILKDDDKNIDGYLQYVEYAGSRRTSRVLEHSARMRTEM